MLDGDDYLLLCLRDELYPTVLDIVEDILEGLVIPLKYKQDVAEKTVRALIDFALAAIDEVEGA